MKLLPPELNDRDSEPKEDVAICSSCKSRTPVKICPTEEEGDYESGYYTVHVCPNCEDGGCIDDYDMSPERIQEWNHWKDKQKNQS